MIFILDLPGFVVKNVAMSIYWLSLVSGANSVHLAIRKGLYPKGQKLEYSEWLLTNVLKDVPHRQWVFSIPKRLRIYFLYDRKLLAKLSICGWKVLSAYLKSAVSYDGAVPGASIAVQTYGDFQNFNPHLHAIVSDGCFMDDDSFQMAPGFILKDLEEAFQYEVLKMLKKEGKINDAVIP